MNLGKCSECLGKETELCCPDCGQVLCQECLDKHECPERVSIYPSVINCPDCLDEYERQFVAVLHYDKDTHIPFYRCDSGHINEAKNVIDL